MAVKGVRRFFLCYSMILGNALANAVGVMVISGMTRFFSLQSGVDYFAAMHGIALVFDPLAFILPASVQFWFGRPVHRAVGIHCRGGEIPPELLAKAQRRLLNEPYFAMAMDILVWALAALVFYLPLAWSKAPDIVVLQFVLRCVVTGVITVTIAFFVLEHNIQARLAPIVFPRGGLYTTPRTLRTGIGVRLAVLVFAISIVPLAAIQIAVLSTEHAMLSGVISHSHALDSLQRILLMQTVIFMAVAALLASLVTKNITQPLKEIISVLQEVGRGLFQRKVRVTSNDEIGYTGDSINQMTDDLQERDFIKETFGKYVSAQVRDEILDKRVRLDGEMKDVTVLFADLRGFTPLVESTPPQEVVAIINGYFREMSEAISASGGLVLQYIGDEIEAVFGAPLPLEGHAAAAVRAAVEMRSGLERVNLGLEEQGLAPLRHGIGIHSGPALAANIGSPERLSYALVGDTVNVASRIQGLTKDLGHDIIISASTQSALNGEFDLNALPAAKLKGHRQEVEIYVLG